MNHLAVAHNDGCVSIRKVEGIEEAGEGDVNVKLNYINNKVVHKINNIKEWCEVLEYNKEGTKLAIGSHDNAIYVYNCKEDCKY